MLDGLVVAAGREREQPGGHPAPGREPQVGGSSQCCRDPRATGGLVAEQCLDPSEEAERLHPIAAQRGAGGRFGVLRRGMGLAEQAEVDLGRHLERQRVVKHRAVARIASPGGSGVGGLARPREVARTQKGVRTCAEQPRLRRRPDRRRLQPFAARLPVAPVPLQCVPEPGPCDHGDAAVPVARESHGATGELERTPRAVRE